MNIPVDWRKLGVNISFVKEKEKRNDLDQLHLSNYMDLNSLNNDSEMNLHLGRYAYEKILMTLYLTKYLC